MDAIPTKLMTGASLGRARFDFELCAFRSNITARRQNFDQCIIVSRAWKKYVQKSGKLQEMALSMFWVLDCSSAMECKTVGSCDKQQQAWRAWRNLDFHLQKVQRFVALDVTF